jgi:diacylglycerol kinase (ATP)
MDRGKPRGYTRLVRAAGASARGLAAAWREESAFRQELVVVAAAAPLGLWLGRTGVERALLVAPLLLVLVIELLNSGIEAAIDRMGMERHELAGMAKDCGSAAVMVSLVLCGACWLLVLLDH